RFEQMRPKPPITEAKPDESRLLVRPIADYLGRYTHPAYGEIEIAVENDQLVMHFHKMKLTLNHLHDGIFKIHSDDSVINDIAKTLDPLFFQIDGTGNICELFLRLEPTVAPIPFTRLSP